MQKENKIEILPVLQTGSNCKTTAIAALEQYFGEKLGYSPIPLHKRFEGSALMSMREIAKKFGSRQGELLEIKLVTDILNYIGFDAEVAECDSLANFRNFIIQNLAKKQPLIIFFAVDLYKYLSGFPDSSTSDGTNEHAALITGFDEKEDNVTIMHWGQYYTFPIPLLFNSNQALPATRQKEAYKPIKNENLIRKYHILNDEEIKKQTGNEQIKVSIEPKPNSGFKNKLVQLKTTPDLKNILARRKEILSDTNLDYLVKRIVKIVPYSKKEIVEKSGKDYKSEIQLAINNFLKENDEENFLKDIELANKKFFSDIFGDEKDNFFIDFNRKKSVTSILQKFKIDITLKISENNRESKTQSSQTQLYMIEHTVKKEVLVHDEIFYEDEKEERYEKNIKISARSFEDEKNSKFKTLDIGSLFMDIALFTSRPILKINITISNIPYEIIKNDENFKSLLSKIQPKIGSQVSIESELDSDSDLEMKELLKIIKENRIYIKDQLNKIKDKYKIKESENEKSDLEDSLNSKLADILLKHRYDMESFSYSKEKIDCCLTMLSIEIHRSLPSSLKDNDQISIPVSLNQGFMIGIFEGFKEALEKDENYPLSKIKSSILDHLSINVNGHCKALSGYRSYCISLEKQKNPTEPLEEIVKRVSKKELTIIQAMDDYRNKKQISIEDHLKINSFIFSVITSQVHGKDIMSGKMCASVMGHDTTFIDHEDRVMKLVKVNSSHSKVQDFEGILKELIKTNDDGEYIIYNSFSRHQTFFLLSKQKDKIELVFSDPNLPEYIFYDLNDDHCLEKIMKQLNDSHPDLLVFAIPFYVTQLSPPNQKPGNEYGCTDMAWHAEQGNLELFQKTCEPELLSVKDSRGITPLIGAVKGGHTKIVSLILDEKYVDKEKDIRNAIYTAIEEQQPEIINLLSKSFDEELRKNALQSLMTLWNKGFSTKDVAVFDALLKCGIDVTTCQSETGKSWMSQFLDMYLWNDEYKIWNHFLECKEAHKVILWRSQDNSTILMDILNSNNPSSIKQNILLSTLRFCKQLNVLEQILPIKNKGGLTVFELAQKDLDCLKILKQFEPTKLSSFLKFLSWKRSSTVTPAIAGYHF